ncbi:BrnT family toxin [Thermodesulfobacteriota bacterium]
MKVNAIIWKERFVEKISAKHGVSVTEAEELFRYSPIVRRMTKGRVRGEDVYSALAQITSGRYLIVFFIRKKHGMILPISARDMDVSERRYYAKHR